MSAQTEKMAPDWELIERHYRAGLLSLREIASLDGNVTEGAIRKRAKRDLWTRDLGPKIQQKADELVRRKQQELVRKPGTQLTPSTERQEVESSAQVVANIRLAHQADIGRSRALFGQLLGEIEAATLGKDGFDSAVEAIRQALAKVADADELQMVQMRATVGAVREQIGKLVGVSGRIDSAKKLVEMLERLVKMEREAFGIGAENDDKDSIEELVMRVSKEL